MTGDAPRKTAAGACVAVLLAGSAGCGDADPDPDLPEPVAGLDSPRVEPAPTPSLTAEESEAVAEVTTAYDSFMTVYVELALSGEPPVGESESRLFRYTETEFGTEARNEIVQDYMDEQVASGELTWTFLEVVEVDLNSDPPQVVLRYCVDSTEWRKVDVSTEEPVSEPAGRYASTVTAHWRDDREFGPEGWALATADDDGSQSC